MLRLTPKYKGFVQQKIMKLIINSASDINLHCTPLMAKFVKN